MVSLVLARCLYVTHYIGPLVQPPPWGHLGDSKMRSRQGGGVGVGHSREEARDTINPWFQKQRPPPQVRGGGMGTGGGWEKGVDTPSPTWHSILMGQRRVWLSHLAMPRASKVTPTHCPSERVSEGGLYWCGGKARLLRQKKSPLNPRLSGQIIFHIEKNRSIGVSVCVDQRGESSQYPSGPCQRAQGGSRMSRVPPPTRGPGGGGTPVTCDRSPCLSPTAHRRSLRWVMGETSHNTPPPVIKAPRGMFLDPEGWTSIRALVSSPISLLPFFWG